MANRLQATKKKDLPARGTAVVQILDAIRLLVAKPHRPADLVIVLGCSRSTVDRLLVSLQAAGLALEVERKGPNAFYSLPREVLAKRLGV